MRTEPYFVVAESPEQATDEKNVVYYDQMKAWKSARELNELPLGSTWAVFEVIDNKAKKVHS